MEFGPDERRVAVVTAAGDPVIFALHPLFHLAPPPRFPGLLAKVVATHGQGTGPVLWLGSDHWITKVAALYSYVSLLC